VSISWQVPSIGTV